MMFSMHLSTDLRKQGQSSYSSDHHICFKWNFVLWDLYCMNIYCCISYVLLFFLYPTLLTVSIFSPPWLRKLQFLSYFPLTFYILLGCTSLVMALLECKNQKANGSGVMDKLFISVRQTQQMWTRQWPSNLFRLFSVHCSHCVLEWKVCNKVGLKKFLPF